MKSSALDLTYDEIAEMLPELREIENKVHELRVCLTFGEISERYADRVNELLQGHEDERLHCNYALHIVAHRFLEIYRAQDEAA